MVKFLVLACRGTGYCTWQRRSTLFRPVEEISIQKNTSIAENKEFSSKVQLLFENTRIMYLCKLIESALMHVQDEDWQKEWKNEEECILCTQLIVPATKSECMICTRVSRHNRGLGILQ